MGCSDQKCGCGNTNELVSITRKEVNQNYCQSPAEEGTKPAVINRNFIIGAIPTPAGAVPKITTRLDVSDFLGAVKVRWGLGRDRYRIDPGLYAVGTPNERSDVLVTANYKLSFDKVRKNLEGMNVWLMVLDTKGVNVWCSAGKGTFGTKELINRIYITSLDKIVQHRRIILPQLGAVGVAAHLVKETSGYTVIYGPVRASDIPSFIHAGYKASKEMRRVKFEWYDRLKLVPNDLIYNLRYLGILLVFFFILSGINRDGFSLRQASGHIVFLSQIIVAGYISGIVLTPLLLPYLLFRSFSFKGLLMGVIVSSIIVAGKSFENTIFITPTIFFLLSGISSFLAMNFTGASTFTSLAGVKKEMRIAVPVQIASVVIAVILIILHGTFSGR
ncbi:MAG: mercury methylation corrinoid protein HgcA [Ignavibacteriales bacterium]|nr:mercury methylation corrinoid protein HgcA [Ignavibacteriales bacterium]